MAVPRHQLIKRFARHDTPLYTYLKNRVPAIRIASAVVTNRGGRTCHAGELRDVIGMLLSLFWSWRFESIPYFSS